jgi:secernin
MCDTYVALPGHTADGSVIFGKNSDRDPNEAQALEWHPAQDHPAGAELQCTWLRIPQVRHTNGVLISRPHWIWGAEMGANSRGVVIGNEAVFTRRERSREPGLIGMDLLRLALERAGTAREALDVITDLLARYGQGGLHSAKLIYHNSYLIADPEGAWVLETAGEFWAAKRVKGCAAISNGLTLGEDFDESSPGLIDAARKLGLLRRGEGFDFARCFADPFYAIFTGCRPRRSRALALLGERAGRMDTADAFAMLRDHGDGGAGYRPDGHFLMSRICSHAANALARDSAQSTGSLVACIKGSDRVFWATGTSAPCTSLFKPVWLEGAVLPDLGPTPGPAFDDASLWWRHELVHRTALRDLPQALEMLVPDRDAAERQLLEHACAAGATQRSALTEKAFRRGRELDESMRARFEGELRRKAKLPLHGSYWRKKNRQAGIRAAV